MILEKSGFLRAKENICPKVPRNSNTCLRSKNKQIVKNNFRLQIFHFINFSVRKGYIN